jgi:outer membrane protein assembly factor BamB
MDEGDTMGRSWVRRGARGAMGAGLAVALAGCWTMPGANADRTAFSPGENVVTIDTIDSLSVKWQVQFHSDDVSEPIVSNAGVHVVATDPQDLSRSVFAFDVDGHQLWELDGLASGANQRYGSTLLTDGDRVSVSAQQPVTPTSPFLWSNRWVDAATGVALTSPAPGHLESFRGNTALALDYNPDTRTDLFEVTPGDDLGGTYSPRIPAAGPLTFGGSVYQAGYGATTNDPHADIVYGNGVRAYQRTDPRRECPDGFACANWATPVDGARSTPVVLGVPSPGPETTVYTATSAGTLYALDAGTGVVRWTAALGFPASQPPALADGVLYAPRDDGKLVALAAGGCGAATCSPLWIGDVGAGPIPTQPSVAGGAVFVGAPFGLAVFRAAGCGAATCDPVREIAMSQPSGAAAVSGGVVYVGTRSGALIALAPSG